MNIVVDISRNIQPKIILNRRLARCVLTSMNIIELPRHFSGVLWVIGTVSRYRDDFELHGEYRNHVGPRAGHKNNLVNAW